MDKKILLLRSFYFLIKTFMHNYSVKLDVSFWLEPDQDRHCVCPDLDPNCLQM